MFEAYGKVIECDIVRNYCFIVSWKLLEKRKHFKVFCMFTICMITHFGCKIDLYDLLIYFFLKIFDLKQVLQ